MNHTFQGILTSDGQHNRFGSHLEHVNPQFNATEQKLDPYRDITKIQRREGDFEGRESAPNWVHSQPTYASNPSEQPSSFGAPLLKDYMFTNLDGVDGVLVNGRRGYVNSGLDEDGNEISCFLA